MAPKKLKGTKKIKHCCVIIKSAIPTESSSSFIVFYNINFSTWTLITNKIVRSSSLSTTTTTTFYLFRVFVNEPSPASFSFIFVFSSKQYNFYNK